MKVVLLAAGRGTRLGPLTVAMPKILVPIAGEPLIARQLRYLARQGAKEVALNLHHHAEHVKEFLRTRDLPVAVHVFEEPTLLGTAGALLPMHEFITERFVLLYGDVVTDADLRALLADDRGIGVIGCYRTSDVSGKGTVEFDRGGQVRAFAEKSAMDGTAAWVNAGIYALDPAITEFIREGDDFGFDVWPRLIADGVPLYARGLGAYVADVGIPTMLKSVEDDLVNGVFEW